MSNKSVNLMEDEPEDTTEEIPSSGIYICSFDIGVKNLAFYIEEFFPDKLFLTLEKSKKVPKTKRRNIKGELVPEFNNVIRSLYKSGRVVFFTKLDVTIGSEKDKYIDPMIFLTTIKELGKYSDYFDKCSAIIIEQQMAFNGIGFKGRKVSKVNTRALKMGQHIFSYFTILYSGSKLIFEFPSYYKTTILAEQKKMKDKERKTWATSEAERLLMIRNDFASIKNLDSFKKRDDIADCIVQAQAWKFLIYIDKVELPHLSG